MSNLKSGLLAVALCALASVVVRAATASSPQTLADQVRAAETAFAKTMADRDFAAFGNYVSSEAIFFGGKGPLRGKAAVLESWKRLYEGPKAPFSWSPESVQVLDSGTLAHSSGPVLDPDGKRVGTFNSIWRLEKDGKWRVIFDKGCDACSCAQGS
jgi:ketosteroid isomerase-like protein